MRILFHLPVYGRPEVTKATYFGLSRLRKELMRYKIELSVLILYSNEADQDLAIRWANKEIEFWEWDSIYTLYAENEPLGAKLNAGLSFAMKELQFDYLMLCGSDNLFHPDFAGVISEQINAENLYFGFKRVIMYNPELQEGREMVYPIPSGVGRMHNRSILERACDCYIAIAKKSLAGRFGKHGKGETVYIPKYQSISPEDYEITGEAWHLWPDNTFGSTDWDSENWLLWNGYGCRVIETHRPLILDIKTDANISKWADFAGNKQNRRVEVLGKDWPELLVFA